MKLANFVLFGNLVIDIQQPKTLIIKNSLLFRSVISTILYQVETDVGDFVLTDNDSYKELKLSSNLIIYSDMYNLTKNTKQEKAKLLQIISQEDSSMYNKNEIVEKLNDLALKISNSFDYPITYKNRITFSDVTKLLDFSIDYSDLDYIDSIVEHMKICSELLGAKIIVTVNLKDSLSAEEFQIFLNNIIRYQIPLLMIERHEHDTMDEKENTIIIDEDLCLL